MSFLPRTHRRPVGAVLAALLVAFVALAVVPAAPAAADPAPAGEGLVAVSYAGRVAHVPADWPVFDLEVDPTVCTRFNRHAVYLGHPGGAQRCPSRPKGLAEVLQIERLDDVSADRAHRATLRLRDGERVPRSITESGGTQFTVVIEDAELLVTAAFFDDPAPVLAAIDDLLGVPRDGVADAPSATTATDDAPTVTQAPEGDLAPTPDPAAEATTLPAPSAPLLDGLPGPEVGSDVEPGNGSPEVDGPVSTLAGTPAARALGPTDVSPPSRSTPAPAAPLAPAAPSTAPMKAGNIIGFAFDTCATPSLAAMQAWLSSPYRTAGVYLGGMNVGCPTAVIDRSWVQGAQAQGWSIMPIYVGRQAPVDICGCASIRTTPASKPRADGAAAADDAVRLAKAAGFEPGTIIYYDMEGYDTSIAANTPAVMKFLAGWTWRLHQLGYLSAVYSSSSSGIRDLANYDGTAAHYSPDTIWLANWNGVIGTYGDRWVPNTMWRSQRVHQFYGARDETWGGVRINIDPNVANGIVNCPGGVCVTAVTQKYELLGGEARHLGAKTGGERATRDGTGRYTPYRLGVIVSSWGNGVFEVHGDIYLKWQSIGATTSDAGYPRADTRTGTDGVSRYTTFQKATIWYTPARKTWVISGPLRDEYNRLGNVSGPLGYPTSDIYEVGSSKRIDFSSGSLTLSSSGKVTATYR